VLVERAARAFVLGLGQLAQGRDRHAIIGLELKSILHPDAPDQSAPPLGSTRACSGGSAHQSLTRAGGHKDIFIS
jgi:hypothetical protein